VQCPECGQEVTRGIRFCPKCRHEFDLDDSRGAVIHLDVEAQLDVLKRESRAPEPVRSLYDNSWAVVIGISRYQTGLELPYVEKDVKRFIEILEYMNFPQDHIIRQLNENATLSHMLRLFSAVLPAKLTPRDRLIIFYAGEVLDVPRKLDIIEPWLVPYDAQNHETWGTNLNGKRLFNWVENSNIQHCYIIIDAPSTGFAQAGKEHEAFTLSWEEAASEPACQLLTAARADQDMYTIGPHSLFLEMLSRGVSGEADLERNDIITGRELGEYAAKHVALEANGRQTPSVRIVSGEGDFIFAPSPRQDKPVAQTTARNQKVHITSEPTAATVYVDKREKGTTPLEFSLPSGEYELKVDHTGYQSFRARLKHKGSQPFSHHVELEALPHRELPRGLKVLSSEYDPVTKLPLRIMRAKDQAEMVLVPAGYFMMGYNNGEADEQPSHNVKMSPFYIDRYAVSNSQFEYFIRVIGPKYPKYWRSPHYSNTKQPVVGIDWTLAKRYCDWVDADLPTEAQWEKAGMGTDARIFPWGNREPTPTIAFFAGSKQEEGPGNVDFFRNNLSPYGAEQLSGNVWEWCSDWYDRAYYVMSPKDDPEGPGSGKERVIRGGAWNSPASELSLTKRGYRPPSYRGPDVGFRCTIRFELKSPTE